MKILKWAVAIALALSCLTTVSGCDDKCHNDVTPGPGGGNITTHCSK